MIELYFTDTDETKDELKDKLKELIDNETNIDKLNEISKIFQVHSKYSDLFT